MPLDTYETLYNRIKEFQIIIAQNIKSFESEENEITSNNQVHIFFWKSLDYHAEYSLRLSKALSSLAASDLSLAMKQWNDFHSFICTMKLIIRHPLMYTVLLRLEQSIQVFNYKNHSFTINKLIQLLSRNGVYLFVTRTLPRGAK